MSVLAARAAAKYIQKDSALMKQTYWHKERIAPIAPGFDRSTKREWRRTREAAPLSAFVADSTMYHLFPQKDFNMNCLFNDILAYSQSPSGANKPPSGEDLNGASPEQLMVIQETLAEALPKFFTQAMDYTIYHPKLEFVNNIKGTRTIGVHHYAKQISLLRAFGHIRYGYVTFHILKITKRAEDSSVIVRWRIKGVGGFKALLIFWRVKLWKLREGLAEEEVWYDALSTFYVGSDGKVYKHIVDKMMPDEENSVDAIMPKSPIAAKLAMLLGLLPKGQMYGLSSGASGAFNCSDSFFSWFLGKKHDSPQ